MQQLALHATCNNRMTSCLCCRGEGWGRPHVEAMSMELPVIATNWSGPTAFLDERVGYPLRFQGLEEVSDTWRVCTSGS